MSNRETGEDINPTPDQLPDQEAVIAEPYLFEAYSPKRRLKEFLGRNKKNLPVGGLIAVSIVGGFAAGIEYAQEQVMLARGLLLVSAASATAAWRAAKRLQIKAEELGILNRKLQERNIALQFSATQTLLDDAGVGRPGSTITEHSNN